MAMGLAELGRALIGLGVGCILLGAVVTMGSRIPWLGRLPGDLLIQRERFTFFFPLATCLVFSILLSLAAWLFIRR